MVRLVTTQMLYLPSVPPYILDKPSLPMFEISMFYGNPLFPSYKDAIQAVLLADYFVLFVPMKES